MKFRVGDRVTRPVDVFTDESPLRHGIVVRRYHKHIRYGWDEEEPPVCYPELYDVVWDGGKEEEAFLPHGIDRERPLSRHT